MQKFPQNDHLLFINSAFSSIFDENHPWFSPLRGALRASKFIPDEFLLRFSSSTRIFRDPFKGTGLFPLFWTDS